MKKYILLFFLFIVINSSAQEILIALHLEGKAGYTQGTSFQKFVNSYTALNNTNKTKLGNFGPTTGYSFGADAVQHGGKTTAGLKRTVSLRMMQHATYEFLKATRILSGQTPDDAVRVILDFWKALATVLPAEWSNTRHHMLTKGIGVYALMRIAADIFTECRVAGRPCDRRAFAAALADFANDINWSTTGPLKGFGGQGGVKAAVEYISEARKRARYKVVNG